MHRRIQIAAATIGDPREHVAGLGAERARAAHAAQGAGQAAAAAALHEHQQDQEDRHDRQQDAEQRLAEREHDGKCHG